MALECVLLELAAGKDPKIRQLDTLLDTPDASEFKDLQLFLDTYRRLKGIEVSQDQDLRGTIATIGSVYAAIAGEQPHVVLQRAIPYLGQGEPEVIIPLVKGMMCLEGMYRSVVRSPLNPYVSGFGIAARCLLGSSSNTYVFNMDGHAIKIHADGATSGFLASVTKIYEDPDTTFRRNAPDIALALVGFGDGLLFGVCGMELTPSGQLIDRGYLRAAIQEAYGYSTFWDSAHIAEVFSTLGLDRAEIR